MSEKTTLYKINIYLIEDGKYVALDINNGEYYLEYKFKKNLKYTDDCSLRLKKYEKVLNEITNSVIERGHKIYENNNVISNSFSYLAFESMKAARAGSRLRLCASIVEEVDENGNKTLYGEEKWI